MIRKVKEINDTMWCHSVANTSSQIGHEVTPLASKLSSSLWMYYFKDNSTCRLLQLKPDW